MKRNHRKKEKDYVPFWWVFIILLIEFFSGGASIDQDGYVDRYREQRRTWKKEKRLAKQERKFAKIAKKQNNHE
ncbi:hypothetical protein LT336_00578 [Spiroplasma sp. JKS002671]|uniref:hypothetical protein n=1 Tax=Spiroplasma attinicola TaxID=2904537 RepID=UPI002022AA41|nr:hypothetical protein [Spiroplasma sp. JKS002671]MCL8210834.1 hypothetical protein [Spiroplasma sp. JKS002671]